MSEGIRFKIDRSPFVGGSSDVALLEEDEPPMNALTDAVIDNIATDLMVTISGVTMFLAAWQDPDHWIEEWREQAGQQKNFDFNAEEYVLELLAQAVEEL